VPSNQNPWIEINRSSHVDKFQQEVSGSARKLAWQAMFACRLGLLPFEDRLKLKWGFSPEFLLNEALDRQKLFIESQLFPNPIDHQIEQRTLALRCVCVPNVGILLGLVGKIRAESEEKAQEFALDYFQEIKAVFPYDYTVEPGKTEEEFKRLTGREILEECNHPDSIAQIRRFENPLQTTKGVFRMLGLWQTGARSDEQIWRALAQYPQGIILNISISPTTLFEDERRALLEMNLSAQGSQDTLSSEPYLNNYEAWIGPFVERYLSPWNRYFYLQVHLASPSGIKDYVARSVGSALTRENEEMASPGFQVVHPVNKEGAKEWCHHLDCLDRTYTSKSLFLPRLSDLVSLDEAHAVFRLPYPPETGIPGAVFL
jgi:hypothetical protein